MVPVEFNGAGVNILNILARFNGAGAGSMVPV
jgi:hypothetical protein